MHLEKLLWAAAIGLFALGCGDDDGKTTSTGTGGAGGDGAGGEAVGPPTSPKANVKFLGAQRLAKQLGRALGLEPNEICKELGAHDCIPIHGIALGGTDAFGAGIYEPLKATTASTPIAVDRVALAGCVKRVDLDLAAPSSAVLFVDLPIDGTGKLSDVGADPVTRAIERLYERGLSRAAKAHEIEASKQLYADIEASGQTERPARDWAVLTCLATLTTMESLFY